MQDSQTGMYAPTLFIAEYRGLLLLTESCGNIAFLYNLLSYLIILYSKCDCVFDFVAIEELEIYFYMASTPPRKRPRRDEETFTLLSKLGANRLYAPFRALGLVTNHVPLAVQTRAAKGSTAPPRIHIVTCLGKSWMMWEGEKMTLLFVGTCVTSALSKSIGSVAV